MHLTTKVMGQEITTIPTQAAHCRQLRRSVPTNFISKIRTCKVTILPMITRNIIFVTDRILAYLKPCLPN